MRESVWSHRDEEIDLYPSPAPAPCWSCLDPGFNQGAPGPEPAPAPTPVAPPPPDAPPPTVNCPNGCNLIQAAITVEAEQFTADLQTDFDRFGRWGVTAIDAPNVGEYLAGGYNVVYGTASMIAGAALVVGGGTAEVTVPIFGQVGGTPVVVVGAYKVLTGYARTVRGAEQLLDVLYHPIVHKSPQQLLGDALFGVLPSGNTLEGLVGGLP